MHTLLVPTRRGQVVDHINGDRLDNRRGNLRAVSALQNSWNQGKRRSSRNTSEYKGVSWHSRDNMWRVRVHANGKLIVQRYFRDELEAARAYDAVARIVFGQYARLNFSENTLPEKQLHDIEELDQAA